MYQGSKSSSPFLHADVVSRKINGKDVDVVEYGENVYALDDVMMREISKLFEAQRINNMYKLVSYVAATGVWSRPPSVPKPKETLANKFLGMIFGMTKW